MTHEKKVDIYREIEMEFLTQDARNHVDDMIDREERSVMSMSLKCLTDDDLAYLAETFRDDHDCNVADNMQWEDIIQNYVYDDRVYARPECEVIRLYKKYKADWIKNHVDDACLKQAYANYNNRGKDDKDMSFDEYIEEHGYPGSGLYNSLDVFIDEDIEDYLEDDDETEDGDED